MPSVRKWLLVHGFENQGKNWYGGPILGMRCDGEIKLDGNTISIDNKNIQNIKM